MLNGGSRRPLAAHPCGADGRSTQQRRIVGGRPEPVRIRRLPLRPSGISEEPCRCQICRSARGATDPGQRGPARVAEEAGAPSLGSQADAAAQSAGNIRACSRYGRSLEPGAGGARMMVARGAQATAATARGSVRDPRRSGCGRGAAATRFASRRTRRRTRHGSAAGF